MEPTSASEAGGSPPPGRGSGPGRGRGRGRGQGRGSNHGRAASSRHAPKPTSITAEGMEQTSASEMSHSPPNGLGRGRGRGCGRAVSSSNAPKRHSQGASSSHAPKTKKASRKAKKLKSWSWLRKTTPGPTHEREEDTSISEETGRIAAASARTRDWVLEESTSSEEEWCAAPKATAAYDTPDTSGVFDYATWSVARLTQEQRVKLTRAFTWIDLCAGLGTPIFVHEALRQALEPYDLRPAGECTGMTEINKERREALKRRAMCVFGRCPPIFCENASLTTQTPKDDQGSFQDPPVADILFLGIVCVDISACSSTPKSLEDPDGLTGKSWLDFLKYLDNLSFEHRPKALVLECVDKLGQNRSVQGRVEKGTVLVVEALRERGYVGQWRKVSPTHYFLPQRRPRVWALFLKVLTGMGPKAIQNRERDLEEAFDFINSSQTSCYEPLKRILDRTPAPDAPRPSKPSRKGGNAWATTQGPNFQRKHGLSDEEVARGQDEFLQATADVLLPRQQAAVWLELCRLRLKGRVPNWKEGVLVGDVGSSVGWLSLARDMFPCIRPGNSYMVLDQGKPKLAPGTLCLALQGIGRDEAAALQLLQEEDCLLRQLAGNAFCANICLVFLMAALFSW